MRHTQDSRGESYWDIFPVLPGQVNVSQTLKGQKRGFHLHHHKTDYWVVIQGKLQVVLLYPENDTFVSQILNPGELLEITPGIWHAYQALEDSLMIYYETNKSGSSRIDDLERPLTDYNGWL